MRPCPNDVALFRAALGKDPGHGLLLGLTPELRALSDVLAAVDYNPAMIDKWGREEKHSGQSIRLGNWLDIACMFPMGAFDFAAGDGAVNMLDHPLGQRELFEQLRQVLKKSSLFVFRLFAAQARSRAESVEDVMQAASDSKIGSFHAFKWRFAHALVAERDDPNIPVTAILESFNWAVPDRRVLAVGSGWPIEQIDTIDAYDGSANVYSFPSIEEFETVLPSCSRIENLAHADYELGERCPIISIRVD